MKSTPEQLITFLKGVGVDVELVDKEEEADFDKDAVLSSLDDNRKKILKPLIEEELTENIKKDVSGRYGGTLRSQLARISGMKRVDLDKFDTDEEAIKAAWGHTSGMLDSEKAEFKKQLDEVLNTHKSEVDTLKNDYEGKLSQANQKYIDRNINEYIAAQLKDAPLPKGADRNIVAADLANALRSKYHLNYDEAANAVELFMKDNPNMPAMNQAKNARINISDEAKEFLSPRGLWMEDMRNVNPADEMNNQNTTNNQQRQSNVIPLTNSLQEKKTGFMKKLSETLPAEK